MADGSVIRLCAEHDYDTLSLVGVLKSTYGNTPGQHATA